jgi:hypothetical protein
MSMVASSDHIGIVYRSSHAHMGVCVIHTAGSRTQCKLNVIPNLVY